MAGQALAPIIVPAVVSGLVGISASLTPLVVAVSSSRQAREEERSRRRFADAQAGLELTLELASALEVFERTDEEVAARDCERICLRIRGHCYRLHDAHARMDADSSITALAQAVMLTTDFIGADPAEVRDCFGAWWPLLRHVQGVFGHELRGDPLTPRPAELTALVAAVDTTWKRFADPGWAFDPSSKNG